MLNVQRASHVRESSQPTIINSSHEFKSNLSSGNNPPLRPATSLSQRFSNTSGPSTSFFAANGEIRRARQSAPQENQHGHSHVDGSSQHTATGLSRRFSNASGVSTSLSATNDNSRKLEHNTTRQDSQDCAAQMDVETDCHGVTNPVSFELDQSKGYLPFNVQSSNFANGIKTPEAGYSSLESFLQAVSCQRLKRMPHRASKWDQIIRTLECLAIQVSAFMDSCDSLPPGTYDSASRTYATCYNLLRLSSNRPAFLNLALPILAEARRVFASMLWHKGLFGRNERIKQFLSQFLASVLKLMTELLNYGQGIASDRRTGPDHFRSSISVIHDHSSQLVAEFWACQLHLEPHSLQDVTSQINCIRHWLRPNDGMISAISASLQAKRALHAEFTCEWFSKPLLDFIRSSNKVFWIEGPIGCGKSMLCGWIIDSLLSQVGGHEYVVLSHYLDPLLPSEMDVFCLLKALLQQAFEQSPGLISLYEALSRAMGVVNVATPGCDLGVNDALWHALEVALQQFARPSIIVIDGLNGLSGGGAAATACLQRLSHAVSNSRVVRLLILSRPLEQLPDTGLRRFTIQPSNVREDVSRVIESTITTDYPEGRLEVRDWIIGKANGNFLWGLLTLRNWRSSTGQGNTVPLRSLPTTLDATAAMSISKIDFHKPTICLLLSAALVAVRPLSVGEAQILLNINVSNRSLDKHDHDIARIIDHGGASGIMTVENSIINFRHPLFKQFVHGLAETKMRKSLEESHIDMFKKLLVYLSLVFTTEADLTMKLIDTHTMEELLSSQQLLTYALRYWTYHFVQSGRSQETEVRDQGSDFRHVLPDSNYIAALEAAYWATQPSVEAIRALQIAAQMRRDVLGDNQATLQALGFLALVLKNRGQLPEAASAFATAFELAQQIMPEFHHFAVDCVTECLTILEAIPDIPSLDLPVSVPDMLRYMISNYSQQVGPGHDRTLESYQRLARYYADTDQFGLSTKVQRDIYRLTIERYGKTSSQAQAAASDLTALVQNSDRSDDNEQDNELVYVNVMSTLAITDSRRIKASILKAETCNLSNDIVNAELEYLRLLHGVTETYQLQPNDEDQLKVMRIGTLYARFLSEHGRRDEAQSVLLGLWAYFADEQDIAPVAFDLLTDIALEIKQAGLPAMALTILRRIAKIVKPQEVRSAEVHDVESTISAITTELVSNIQPGDLLSKTTEDALTQTFETLKSHGPLDSLIHVCQSLIDSFILEGRWHDVLHVASSALNLLWPAVQQDPAASLLSDSFDLDKGEIAVKLAQAYSMIDAEESAGRIYWQVLRAARSANATHLPFFAGVAKAAVKTFEKTGQTKQMLDATQELVGHYRVSLGDDDPTTIEASYTLASLCVDNGDIEAAKRLYTQIASNFQRPDHHDQRALPALQALLAIFLGKKLWDQGEKIYSSLWQTFLHKGKEYCMNQTSARRLYEGYFQLLENHLNAGDEALEKLRTEYRIGSATVFGERDPITLETIVDLARMLERVGSRRSEAIQLYESIVFGQQGCSVVHQPNIMMISNQVQSILREHYHTQLDDDMDRQTLSRAAELSKLLYQDHQMRYGDGSPKSLSSLAVWISYLIKQGSSASREIAIHELRLAVEFILLSDCEGKALVDAATILATSYVEGKYANEGLNMVEMIRKQLIFREQSNAKSHLWSRSKLTFLTAFETGITQSEKAFAETYSRFRLEVALWDSFQALQGARSAPELVLDRGAKLQALLKFRYSTYDGKRLQQQLFDLFMDSYGVAFTSGTQTVPNFFEALLDGLGTRGDDGNFTHLACITLTEEAQRLVGRKEFREALDLSIPGFDFIRHVGAYGHETGLQYGFQLGLILGDLGPRLSLDQTLSKQMLELSKQVLREILQLCRTKEIDLDKISIEELSEVAAVLGRQQNYYDLEWLLNRLWASRHRRGSLSQEAIVTLGRRLVDVRFFHGHIDSAIDLAEDILYNLRQVYGPSHPSAVQMMNLLSSIYMSKGDRAAAMAVHEAIDSIVDTSQLVHHANVPMSSASAQDDKLLKSKIEDLLHCYQQSDNPDKSVGSSAQLIDELSKRLHAPTSPNINGNLVVHQPPASWSFAIDGDGDRSSSVRDLA